MNNYSTVSLIDNTKIGELQDNISVKGFSRLTKQLYPTQGIILTSDTFSKKDMVFFKYIGNVKLTEKIDAIDDNSIFICNDKLIKSGVIVERFESAQKYNGLNIRTQEWFKVVDSFDNYIKKGSLIVAKPHTSFRFNKDGKKYYFVDNINILLVIAKRILPGPCNLFIEKPSFGIFDKRSKKIGLIDGVRHVFKTSQGTVNINGKELYIIRAEHILASNIPD